jgi:hypothetical protein
MSGSLPQETHRYDVCFFVNRRRALHWLDRGITLGADRLSCTANGPPGAEPFDSVAAVHLKTCGQKSNIESCAITFADDNVLTVLNCNPGGYADAALAANYRAFVRDLHARLAATAPGKIRFTEGWPLWHCQAMLFFTVGTAVLSAGLGLWGFSASAISGGSGSSPWAAMPVGGFTALRSTTCRGITHPTVCRNFCCRSSAP